MSSGTGRFVLNAPPDYSLLMPNNKHTCVSPLNCPSQANCSRSAEQKGLRLCPIFRSSQYEKNMTDQWHTLVIWQLITQMDQTKQGESLERWSVLICSSLHPLGKGYRLWSSLWCLFWYKPEANPGSILWPIYTKDKNEHISKTLKRPMRMSSFEHNKSLFQHIWHSVN